MPRKECPSCAVEIQQHDEVCPICGYEFPRRKSWPRWIAVLVLILISIAVIRLLTNYVHLL